MADKHFTINKVTKLEDSEVEITGDISISALTECRKEALEYINKSLSLPGFRKGQIPEATLVKTVGEGQILAETAEIALAREYGFIIEEAKLRPIARPQITITNLAPNAPLSFKATVIVEPQFKLPDYKKIAKEITDEDIEKRRVKIVDALVKATKLELPKKFVEGEINHVLSHFKHDLAHAGLDWEEYLKKAEKTEDEIKETWREHVVNRSKPEFILAKIAAEEGVKTYPEVFAILEKAD